MKSGSGMLPFLKSLFSSSLRNLSSDQRSWSGSGFGSEVCFVNSCAGQAGHAGHVGQLGIVGHWNVGH
jgi:hypothetical protein